jgi:hypothetical protein
MRTISLYRVIIGILFFHMKSLHALKSNLLDYCSQKEGECQKIAKTASLASKYFMGMSVPVYITALQDYSGDIRIVQKQPFTYPTAMFMVKVGELSVASGANSSIMFQSNSVKLLACALFRKKIICSSELEWYNKEKELAIFVAKLKIKLDGGKVQKVYWEKYKCLKGSRKTSLNGSVAKRIRREKDIEMQVLIGWEGTDSTGQIVSIPFPPSPPEN